MPDTYMTRPRGSNARLSRSRSPPAPAPSPSRAAQAEAKATSQAPSLKRMATNAANAAAAMLPTRRRR